MNKLIALALSLVVLSACNNNQDKDKEIDATITSFYKESKPDHNQTNKTKLTKSLAALLDKAIAKEKSNAEQMEQSATPNDKPDLIEGDVFTSLYEGPGEVHPGKIEHYGDSAVVVVDFTNDDFKVSWKDTVVLKKEDGWKIDNVIFAGEGNSGNSTRQVLETFINKK